MIHPKENTTLTLIHPKNKLCSYIIHIFEFIKIDFSESRIFTKKTILENVSIGEMRIEVNESIDFYVSFYGIDNANRT